MSTNGSLSGAVFAAIFLGLPGLGMTLFSRRKDARIAGVFMILSVPAIAAISGTDNQYYLRLQHELASGQTAEIVGTVGEAHIIDVGKHTSFRISVEGIKFDLPSYFPSGCKPIVGENVEIAAEASSVTRPGDLAEILRMRVPKGTCHPPVRSVK